MKHLLAYNLKIGVLS